MRNFASLVLMILLWTGVAYGQARSITVIKRATLIDGTGRQPLHNSVIVIEGERIKAVGVQGKIKIPRGARIIDARGKFITPGLIDCHCHMEMIGLGDLADLPPEWDTPEKRRQLTLVNAKLDLLAGITTVRDLGSTDALFKIRDEINTGAQIGPRIFASGQQLVKKSPGAYLDKTFIEYDGPDDVREKVRRQIALGAEWIKIRIPHRPGRPLPSVEEMRAIVEEAHRLGRRVAVHTDVPDDEAVQFAVNAGVDSIEHNAALRVKDEKTLLEMARKGIALMPGPSLYVQRLEDRDAGDALTANTKRLMPAEVLAVLNRIPDLLGQQTESMKKSGWDPKQIQARFVSEMRRAREAGVLLVFGTDCGAELMVHGQQYKALYGETQMGSTPMEAILMATRNAAKALGKEKDLGTVEAGKFADLIILDADPLADLRNLHKVNAVIKGGAVYRPAELIGGPERSISWRDRSTSPIRMSLSIGAGRFKLNHAGASGSDYTTEMRAAHHEVIKTGAYEISKIRLGAMRPGENIFSATVKNKTKTALMIGLDLATQPGLWLRKRFQKQFYFDIAPKEKKQITAVYQFLRVTPEASLSVRLGTASRKEDGSYRMERSVFDKRYYVGRGNKAVDYDGSQFKKYETEHFEIYYFKGSLAERDATSIAQLREAAFRQISNLLQVKYDRKIRLVFYPDGETKRQDIGHTGDGYAFANNIVEVYNEQTKLDPFHELTHILASKLGNPPAMFNEGFAVYMSERLGADALKYLGSPGKSMDLVAEQNFRDGKLIALAELLKYTEIGSEQSKGPITYPEAASVVKYLIETFGIEKFREVYQRTNNSDEPNDVRRNLDVLNEIFGKSLSQMEQEWLQKLVERSEASTPWQKTLAYRSDEVYPIEIGKFGYPYVTVSINGEKLMVDKYGCQAFDLAILNQRS